MSARGDRRDELLGRALFEDDGDAALARDPALKESAEELREVARRLERAGQEEYETLVNEGTDPELERAAGAALERVMEGATSPGSPARLLWLAAAGIVLLLGGWLALRPSNDGPEPYRHPLGTGGYATEHPLGTVEAYGTFEWRGELPEGGWYELRIWSADADPLAEPIVRRRLEEARWEPEARVSLPTSIRWQVRGFGVTGEPLGRADGDAALDSD